MADLFMQCRRDGHDYGRGPGVETELVIGELQTCSVCECSREKKADGTIVYHDNTFGKHSLTTETEILPNGMSLTVMRGEPGQSLADILKANAGIEKMESVYLTCLPEYEGAESECVFHITRAKTGNRVEFSADNDDIPRLLFRDTESMVRLAQAILEVYGE